MRTVYPARNRRCRGLEQPQDSQASSAVRNRPTAQWMRTRDSVECTGMHTDKIRFQDIRNRHARSGLSLACRSKRSVVAADSTRRGPPGTSGSLRAMLRCRRGSTLRNSNDGGSPVVPTGRMNSRALASTAHPPSVRYPDKSAPWRDRHPCSTLIARLQTLVRLRPRFLPPARLLRLRRMRPSPSRSPGRHRRPT
jgi:hypothetical protein